MILCCGEALIDMIPTPTVAGPLGYVPHCGGAVFNTAIALGRLGAEVGLLTGLSSDLFGDQLRARLGESHVDAAHCIVSDRPTTLAFVDLQEGQARYSFFDENSAGRMLVPTQLPRLSSQVSALYFGGISLACEPCGDSYAQLCAQHAPDHFVMLDPNIRSNFIADEDRFRTRLVAMIGQADILKVSDEDLQWLDRRAVSVREKAKSLLREGPEIVILTLGQEGAVAFTRSGACLEVTASPVSVVDTVGAGDTFNAGLLASLAAQGLLSKAALSTLSPESLHKAVAFGIAVAGVTVSRAGANPPWAAELGEPQLETTAQPC
ncbi:MAG: carbohydrate kinase family protein [Rhodospirillaceae bacterium]